MFLETPQAFGVYLCFVTSLFLATQSGAAAPGALAFPFFFLLFFFCADIEGVGVGGIYRSHRVQ